MRHWWCYIGSFALAVAVAFGNLDEDRFEVVSERPCLQTCFPELLRSPCKVDPKQRLSSMYSARALRSCSCGWISELVSLQKSCDRGTLKLDAPVRVFSPGDGGINCFRIPAVLLTARGTLLAFAEARHGSCNDCATHEIAMRRSVDNGRTWSNISMVVGGRGYYVGNPYPIALSSGRVVLAYVEHKGPWEALGSGNGVIFSDDDGLTWRREEEVGSDFGSAMGNSPGPGAGVETSGRGRRLLVVSHHAAYVETRISYSEDGGRSWNTSSYTFANMDEGTLADLGGGHILLNMRHLDENVMGRAVARSSDGGVTWGDVTYDEALVGPICQGSLAAFGGSVFFSNPNSDSQRAHLTVRRSDDGGRTWPAHLEVHAGTSYGYSSLVQGPVGDPAHGGILYESGYPDGTIDFRVFPLALEYSEIDLTGLEDYRWFFDIMESTSTSTTSIAEVSLPSEGGGGGAGHRRIRPSQLELAYSERHAEAQLELEVRSHFKAMGRAPPPAVVPLSEACSAASEHCLDTLCCSDPDYRCYEKDFTYAQCRTSCEQGLHPDEEGTSHHTEWTCALLSVPSRRLSASSESADGGTSEGTLFV